jgi:TonB family protein
LDALGHLILSPGIIEKLSTNRQGFAEVSVRPFKGDYDFDRPASLAQPPSLLEVNAVYPSAAVRAGGVDGRATVRCHVSSQGVVSRCEALSESPRNNGFGEAVKALARRLDIKPGSKAGEPAASGVEITVEFRGPGRPTGSVLPYHQTMKEERIVSRIDWSRAPSLDQVIAAYPAAARAKGVEGRALLQCVIGETGLLSACDIKSEFPTGQRFGEAARSLMPHFSTVTSLSDGKSIQGVVVDIPVAFDADLLERRSIEGEPKWERTSPPSSHNIVFGRDAAAPRIEKARAVVECSVGPVGALEECALVSEDPAGYGFGEAALDATAGYVAPRWSPEGTPLVGARVKVPFDFVIAPLSQAAVR